MKLALLPGLDGTGVLFEPLLAILPSNIDAKVVPLKQEEGLSYQDQAEYIASIIGEEKVVVLAESYSGMVAHELTKIKSVNIAHIVFVASFLSKPSSFAQFAKLLPVDFVKNGLFPKQLVGKFLFGSFSNEGLVNLFYTALNKVETKVVKWRVGQVSSISGELLKIEVPCTYIQATHDNLVSNSSLEQFEKCCSSLVVKQLDGTHFLLQTNPVQSAEVLSGIVV